MSRTGPIIVFEDDKDDQDFLRLVFSRLSVPNEIKFFDDAQELLNYLYDTSDKPFIILSDVRAHKMDGIELRRSIMTDPFLRKKSIPFVYLSTSAEADDVLEAYEMEVQGFFLKQNNLSNIQDHIQLILEYWSKCIHPNL